MRIPEFVKEVVWAFYPPRYRQLADKKFRTSLKYMSKILLYAFIIAGIILLPKLFGFKGSVDQGLSTFETFRLTPEISQTAPAVIPAHNPWLRIDMNSDVNLTKEFLVVDKETVQYRFFGKKSVPLEALFDVSGNPAEAGRFYSTVLLMMLPGIILFLYIRIWIKYFLLVLLLGTFFFIVMELTKFRLKWKQVLNIAAHALTLTIFIEIISAAIVTTYLLPMFPFLGINVYAITTALFAVLTVFGIVGYHIGDRLGR